MMNTQWAGGDAGAPGSPQQNHSMRIEVNDSLPSLIQVRNIAKTYTRGSEVIPVPRTAA